MKAALQKYTGFTEVGSSCRVYQTQSFEPLFASTFLQSLAYWGVGGRVFYNEQIDSMVKASFIERTQEN